MAHASWGRSLAPSSPEDWQGDESTIPPSVAPPRSGPLPGPLNVCPVENRRPRNLLEYQAACRAAEGRTVTELDAVSVVPDMQIWHGTRFLSVRYVAHSAKEVEIFMEGDGGVAARRYVTQNTPVYRLV